MNDGKGYSCARRATETDMTFVFQWWIAKGCIFPLPLASLASSKFFLASKMVLYQFISTELSFVSSFVSVADQ